MSIVIKATCAHWGFYFILHLSHFKKNASTLPMKWTSSVFTLHVLYDTHISDDLLASFPH